MNPNEFSDALGDIHETYLDEAVTYRRKHHWITWAAVAACLVLIFNLWPRTQAGDHIPTLAPTGGTQDYYADGVPLSLPQLGESELTLSSVRIDLDIPSLDLNGTNGIGTAVIEITMHNPTDKTLTVPVVLPCGQPPRYLYTYDQSYNSICVYPDQSLYHFTLNGTALLPTLLVTATETVPDEDHMQATKRIRIDSTVTKYTYRITELADSDNPRVALWGFGRYCDYIALAQTGNGYKILHSDDELTIPIQEGDLPQTGDTIILYVIGEHGDFQPGLFFKDWDTKERLNGTTVLESTETLTFLEFASQSWKEQYRISKENWAFSVAAELDPYPVLSSRYVEINVLSSNSHHWFIYDLTLLPGTTSTHRVELPLYPDYLGSGSRTYRFDMRALRALNPTASQTMTLETPLEMTDSTVHWDQNSTTYTLDLSRVNDLELSFALTNPEEAETPADPVPTSPNWWVVGLCVVVLVILFVLRWKIRRQVD